MDIISLLQLARSKKASDLHLVAGGPPVARIHGSLTKLEEIPCLTPEDVQQLFEQLTSSPENREQFKKCQFVDPSQQNCLFCRGVRFGQIDHRF